MLILVLCFPGGAGAWLNKSIDHFCTHLVRFLTECNADFTHVHMQAEEEAMTRLIKEREDAERERREMEEEAKRMAEEEERKRFVISVCCA